MRYDSVEQHALDLGDVTLVGRAVPVQTLVQLDPKDLAACLASRVRAAETLRRVTAWRTQTVGDVQPIPIRVIRAVVVIAVAISFPADVEIIRARRVECPLLDRDAA